MSSPGSGRRSNRSDVLWHGSPARTRRRRSACKRSDIRNAPPRIACHFRSNHVSSDLTFSAANLGTMLLPFLSAVLASPLCRLSSCDLANRTPHTDRATHLVLQAPGKAAHGRLLPRSD
jgi:hypothetical protein